MSKNQVAHGYVNPEQFPDILPAFDGYGQWPEDPKAPVSNMHDYARRLDEHNARLFIDQPKKAKKKDLLRRLMEELEKTTTQLHRLAEQFETELGEKLLRGKGRYFQSFPHDVHPDPGSGVYRATYDDRPCLAWWSGRDWFIQRPDTPNRERVDAELTFQLTWYKKIS